MGKMAKALLEKYGGEMVGKLATSELLHLRFASGSTLRVFKESDAGMYDAVNRGLSKGSAPLCAYLNCDEQYLSGALAKTLKMFNDEPDIEILFGGVLIVGPDGKLISARRPTRLFLPHITTCHLPNFTCAMFFRRRLLQSQNAVFDAKWRECADALWVIERLKARTKIKRTMDFTTAFTDTGANMSLSPNGIREAWEIRDAAPRLWRWGKSFWMLLHWMGKLLDGSYWPGSARYALYKKQSPGERFEFQEQSANPFWVDRWFVRERIRFRNRDVATR
jgi:glycosyltransferase involved in cell wall biosynthesis